MNREVVLSVDELRTYLYTDYGVVRAVDNVSLKVGRDEVVALVGESGCGKTTTAFSIMRLLPSNARILSGQIHYSGTDLLQLSDRRLQTLRGSKIAMIYQDPMTFLNPVLKIGTQVAEALIWHQQTDRTQARERVLDLFNQLRIPSPNRVIDSYPHQLSGGMRQRVIIAMAISCQPDLVIADEPTTALDVSIQAQIMELIKDIRSRLKSSLLLITHDLGLVAEYCDYVYVMYAGEIVEYGDIFTIFEDTRHPYTKALLKANVMDGHKGERFEAIGGEVPSLIDPPSGCRFHPRCQFRMEICDKIKPPTIESSHGHGVSCWLESQESLSHVGSDSN